MTTTLSLTLLCVFLLSAYGWGRLVATFCKTPLLQLRTVVVVSGLALLNVIGGLFNLAGVASTAALIVIIAIGVLLTAFEFISDKPWKRIAPSEPVPVNLELRQKNSFVSSLPLWLALILGFSAAVFLMPASVINYFDDFHTYIPRVQRMLQTGSLAGNPFDGMGLDSLGSQSFFHGFFLLTGDLGLVNGFDGAACFLLALLLAAEVSMHWKLPTALGVLAVVTVAAIHPQHVNISPLYSGVVAIIALMLCGNSLLHSIVSSGSERNGREEFVMALLVTWIATLKITLVFFAGMFLTLLYGLALLDSRNRKSVIKSAALATVITIFLTAPWLLLHWPTLREAHILSAPFQAAAILSTKYPSMATHDIPNLLTERPLFYARGSTLAAYHTVVALCLGAAVTAAWMWRHRKSTDVSGLISIIAAGTTVPIVYLVNAHLFSADTAVRYACPVLIACLGICLLRLVKCGGGNNNLLERRYAVVIGCLLISVIALFGKSFGHRALAITKTRTLISFPINQASVRHCKKFMSQDEYLYTRAVQDKMEAGATALVWTAAPFHCDFSRNRLLIASEPGLINPAISFPAGVGVEELRSYLQSWGIRYVWLETGGPGIKTADQLKPQLNSPHAVYRKLADYGIYFRESLVTLAAQSKTSFSNETMLVFEIGETVTDNSPKKLAGNVTGLSHE